MMRIQSLSSAYAGCWRRHDRAARIRNLAIGGWLWLAVVCGAAADSIDPATLAAVTAADDRFLAAVHDRHTADQEKRCAELFEVLEATLIYALSTTQMLQDYGRVLQQALATYSGPDEIHALAGHSAPRLRAAVARQPYRLQNFTAACQKLALPAKLAGGERYELVAATFSADAGRRVIRVGNRNATSERYHWYREAAGQWKLFQITPTPELYRPRDAEANSRIAKIVGSVLTLDIVDETCGEHVHGLAPAGTVYQVVSDMFGPPVTVGALRATQTQMEKKTTAPAARIRQTLSRAGPCSGDTAYYLATMLEIKVASDIAELLTALLRR